MTRQWRIEYNGALYHVMSRGNEGRLIFSDDADSDMFCNILGDMAERFNIEVHAWVLVNTHYHLLLRTTRTNLSKAMQWLGATYTRRYNLKHKQNGHLFQGRFTSLLVENEKYLFRFSCHIHRNPLSANMAKRLADYKWSSYRTYAYGKPGHDWLTTDLILSQVKGEDRHAAYRKKVQHYPDDAQKISEDIHLGIVAGTKEFAIAIKKKYMPGLPHEEIPQQKNRREEYDITHLIEEASLVLGCDPEAFKAARRIKSADKCNRDILIYLLWKLGAFTNKEIAVHFGLGYSAVSRCVSICNDLIKSDKDFKKGYAAVKSLIKR